LTIRACGGNSIRSGGETSQSNELPHLDAVRGIFQQRRNSLIEKHALNGPEVGQSFGASSAPRWRSGVDDHSPADGIARLGIARDEDIACGRTDRAIEYELRARVGASSQFVRLEQCDPSDAMCSAEMHMQRRLIRKRPAGREPA
jgi:hypothetical protein